MSTEERGEGADQSLMDLADAPWPWPDRPEAEDAFYEAFWEPGAEREKLFAEAERDVSPDISRWKQLLRAVREESDFEIPSRWDNWSYVEAMKAYGL